MLIIEVVDAPLESKMTFPIDMDKSDLRFEGAIGGDALPQVVLEKSLKDLSKEPDAFIVMAHGAKGNRFGAGHHHLVPELFFQIKEGTRFRTHEGWLALDRGQLLLVPPGVWHEEEMPEGALNMVLKIVGNHANVHFTQSLGGSARGFCVEARWCCPFGPPSEPFSLMLAEAKNEVER